MGDAARRRQDLLALVEQGGGSTSLHRLREEVVNGGAIPGELDAKNVVVDYHGRPWRGEGVPLTLRGIIWATLLGVGREDAERYAALIARGRSKEFGQKIGNDTFRTFMRDKMFHARVPEEALHRILNAFVNEHRAPFLYVQGMNVLAGPFLYVLPEPVAYAAFARLLTQHCPRYVYKDLEGVRDACKIADECLDVLDPMLAEHLRGRHLTAQIYAFPSILSLCACTPPLEEVLHLWDILFASGVHHVVLCVLAQVLALRDELLASDSPMKLLRTFPPLDGRRVAGSALALAAQLPPALYARLVAHPVETK